MILTKIIFLAIICILLSVIVSKFNPEFKLYFTILFAVLSVSLIFYDLKDEIQIMVAKVTNYNISIENFSIILKIIAIAYVCDFISLICKDLNYESIGKKIELSGKLLILVYSFNIVIQFVDEVILLVNR